MKIVVCIRTLNEEDFIEDCCKAYQFADKILVADGGSEDRTIEIAKQFPNVEVRNFTEKVECKNGIWRNPDYLHLHFLWDWAIQEEKADWIISQDCDQRPNLHLKKDVREILSNTDKPFLCAVQIFLWMKNYYFPQMSKDGGSWLHGIWAWRADVNLRAIDKMPHYEFSINEGKTSLDPIKQNLARLIDPPYCFLHCKWDTDERVEKIVNYYRTSNLIPTQSYPLDFCGKPEALLDWMVE